MFGKTPEKEPINTELMNAHTSLLTEYRALMAEHLKLLNTLRQTPMYGPVSETPLYYTDDEAEDAAVVNRELRLAPPPDPNPFEDMREDEAELRFAHNLLANAEFD